MAIALVTGASTGIGLATAVRLAQSGHTVYAGVRNPNGTELLQQARIGLPITVVELNVDQEASVTECVAHAISVSGQIDILVNNAGIAGGGPVELTGLEMAQQIFDTNYFGAIRMIRSTLPAMRQRGTGTIINVSSISGRITSPGMGHYSASKHALEAISEVLAAEVLPYGIRVAIVEPGVILTPIFAKMPSSPEPPPAYEATQRRLSQFFTKRLEAPGSAEMVAGIIEHVVNTEDPKLRYFAGADAETLFAGRVQCTDEEWISLGNTQDDDEFFARALRVFGMDFYR